MAHVLAQLKMVPKTQTDEAVNLADGVGLTLLARRYEKPLAVEAFTPLSDDEVIVWRAYCPTTYSDNLGQYGFDNVPLEVMRHWKKIKESYVFDRYEIWTTERTVHKDPLLIGVVGANLYLLARWGLESPEASSLSKIARKLADRLWATNMHDYDLVGFWSRHLENGKLMHNNVQRIYASARRLQDA